jgi:hypothetical protein
MHGLFYKKCGPQVVIADPVSGQCVDTTHYWFDRGELEKALDELNPTVTPPTPSNEIIIVHHTASPRDKTNLEAILSEHRIKYGRSFYQCFITPEGKVLWQHKLTNTRIGAKSIDYCVIGNFTVEKPTEAQLEALNALLGSGPYLGHGKAVEYGATQSECPGTLLADLEAYRKQLDNLQVAINKLVEMVSKLFRR